MPKLAQASGSAADQIRELIRDGSYPPGARLVERALAADLALSRIPVREALRVLVAEGFAIERSTGGVAVRAYDEREIVGMLEVNAALERLVVVDLAARGPAALVTVDAVLDEVSRALADGRHDDAMASNALFHPALVAAADLPVVHEVLGGIRPRLSWLMRLYSDPVPIHAEHLELVDAIRVGDVDRATRVLAEHLETAKRTALGYVRER